LGGAGPDAPPGAPDDLDPAAEVALNPGGRGPGVARVQPQLAQAREDAAEVGEHQPGPVAVGDVGRVDDDLQDQAGGVDQQVALAPAQLLGAVVAARPPFSVVLTDWLSKMAALGVGSRPIRRRVCSRNAACAFSQVPSLRQSRK